MARAGELLRGGATGVALAAKAVGALVRYARDLLGRSASSPQERIRLGIGRALALAFPPAADLVRTAVAPGREETGELVAIAAIRTAPDHFLQREIAREERHVQRDTARDGRVGH